MVDVLRDWADGRSGATKYGRVETGGFRGLVSVTGCSGIASACRIQTEGSLTAASVFDVAMAQIHHSIASSLPPFICDVS